MESTGPADIVLELQSNDNQACENSPTRVRTLYTPVDIKEEALMKTRQSSAGIGADIFWSDVVATAKGTKILDGCWGHVDAGKVCAILGPSGAGKTTLLNVLAGRMCTRNDIVVDCTVRVGERRVNPVKFRKHIAYVMQDDALMATATPREALLFSGNMRLPSSTPKETLETLVETLLADLGLTECADVIIGGPLIKGISGGQRKRTSVGVELITDPQLLFLDEPTTGLDSHSACSLMKLLAVLAGRGSAVLCTIHQPSSEVFALFDTVIFIKSGRVFYQGHVTGINTYFSDRGHKCPENFNPADFVMNLSQAVAGDDLERLFMTVPEEKDVESVSVRQQAVESVSFTTFSGFDKQIAQLTYREWVGVVRDPKALAARYGVTIFLNILYGLIFLRAGAKDASDSTNFNAHVGMTVNSLLATMILTSQSAMLAFPYERPMFLREYSTGTYDVVPYMLSKLTAELPITLVQVLLQYMFVKTMSDLQTEYFTFVALAFGLAMVANSYGMLLGALFSDMKDVVEAWVPLFVPQILFCGLFTRLGQIPVFLRWAQYLCALAYGLKLGFFLEFNPSLPHCQASPEASANCAGIIDSGGPTGDLWWVNALCLFGLFLLARAGAAVALISQSARHD